VIFKLCACIPGPLEGPRQLRVEEHQRYGGDYRYLDSRPTVSVERQSLNSSEDKVHLMITWRVRSISCCFLIK